MAISTLNIQMNLRANRKWILYLFAALSLVKIPMPMWVIRFCYAFEVKNGQ